MLKTNQTNRQRTNCNIDVGMGGGGGGGALFLLGNVMQETACFLVRETEFTALYSKVRLLSRQFGASPSM